MKKLVLSLLSSIIVSGASLFPLHFYHSEKFVVADAQTTDFSIQDFSVSAKSAYVMDSYSKTNVFCKNECQRLPIASMCKVMTLLLAFEKIDNGQASLSDSVTISERASSMGGSQVYLKAGSKHSLENLIKSIIICSANDSCVAVAEYICGTEQAFISKMNSRAKELGCNDTLYSNCTGLPKEPQYSCAKDTAIIFNQLISHEDYFKYSKIWMEDFVHSENNVIGMTNTNKLIRNYDGCDGGKTGFTSQAGFCLVATAAKADTRIVSVVIGEPDSKTRFSDVKNSFDYAFSNYSNKIILKSDEIVPKVCNVIGGKSGFVEVCPSDNAYIFCKKGENVGNISLTYELGDVKAPVEKGQVLGSVKVYIDNTLKNTVPLVAFNSVEKATYADSIHQAARNWNF